MSDISDLVPDQSPPWKDEKETAIECVEKLRLLRENEEEIQQMAQDIFEDGIAMGVSEKSMREAMKKLLFRLAASFALVSLFLGYQTSAQTAAPESALPPAPLQTTAPVLQAAPPPPSSQPLQAVPPPAETAKASADAPASTSPSLSMRATPQVPPTLLPAPSLYPEQSWEGRSIGVVRILDRVTSETKEIEIPVGKSLNFHRLTIKLSACVQRPEGLSSDAALYLHLSEIPLINISELPPLSLSPQAQEKPETSAKSEKDEKSEENTQNNMQRQFDGWFLAAEPAANIYPSPLYNLQALRCAGDPVAPKLRPLKEASVPVNTPEIPKSEPPKAEAPKSDAAKENKAPEINTNPVPSPADNLPVLHREGSIAAVPDSTASSAPAVAPVGTQAPPLTAVPAAPQNVITAPPAPEETSSKKKKHKHHKHKKDKESA